MSKAGFSISDLQQGAKKLNNVTVSESKNAYSGSDPETLAALESIYQNHDGDLDAIFNELKADPSKAKKPHHRPRNAKEFAEKYAAGFYSLVEDEDVDSRADSKSSHK